LILFCDTSALLKLYLDEPESATVHELAAAADNLAACRIVWAGFARKEREAPHARDALAAAKAVFAAAGLVDHRNNPAPRRASRKLCRSVRFAGV
jgi:predicted nucleic acid-binding protein